MSLRKRAETTQPAIEEEEQEEIETSYQEKEEQEEALPFAGDAKAAAEEAAAEEAAKLEAKAAAMNLAKQQQQQLATKETTAVATQAERKTTADLFKQAGKALEEAGFGGLDYGFGAYAIISLQNEGMFEDSNDDSFGKEFKGIILESRDKYVFNNTKCEKKDEVAVYSYDGVLDANTDQPIQKTIEEWAEKGWGFERRPYTEVTVDLVEGPRAGEIVLLSLPKTSRTKFTGYINTNARRFRLLPSQYITQFSVGDKVTSTPFPFFPWKFTFVKELPTVEG